jgi:hypothetical protein
LSKSDEIKTSDDAEIIPATFESLPQVRIWGLVCVYNASIPENDLWCFSAHVITINQAKIRDLKVRDAVTNETRTSGEEWVATYSMSRERPA